MGGFFRCISKHMKRVMCSVLYMNYLCVNISLNIRNERYACKRK